MADLSLTLVQFCLLSLGEEQRSFWGQPLPCCHPLFWLLNPYAYTLALQLGLFYIHLVAHNLYGLGTNTRPVSDLFSDALP